VKEIHDNKSVANTGVFRTNNADRQKNLLKLFVKEKMITKAQSKMLSAAVAK